ncbi:MAG: DUF3488 and transglutaminase-like domain-containing protein [Burkholderiaceae bacterium]
MPANRPAPGRWPLSLAALKGLADAQVSTGARERRDTLLLLAAAALVVVPHFAHVAWWISLSVAALFAWRGGLTVAQRPLPGRVVMLSLLLAAALAIWLQYRSLLGREAGVAFLLLLMGLKLMEMRARRDVFVVITLAFFILLTQFLNGQGLAVAALSVVAVIALFVVLASVNYDATDVPARAKLRLVLVVFAKAVPIAALLFLLFPRIQGPLWGLPGGGAVGTTGLSNTMSPGSLSRVIKSDAIAFRARFETAAPANTDLYWRGPVLGQFDGRTWTALSERTRRPPQLEIRFERASEVAYDITLEAHRQRWLLMLDAPLAAPEAPGLEARLSPELEALSRQPIEARLRYQARSATDFHYGLNTSAPQLRDWLQLPAAYDPRSMVFARQLRESVWPAGSPQPPQLDARLTDAVLEHFRASGFVYTLEPPPLGRNTIDDFLFKTRAGYCENYASAFVFLMRALEVPARVVTGYQGGEINPADGFMTVRQSDAHAWAEVWLAGRGWTRVDPTAMIAPARINQGAPAFARQDGRAPLLGVARAPEWLRSLRFGAEAVQNAWNQWVLSYSPERQRSLVRWLGLDPDWHGTVIALVIGLAAALAGISGIAWWRRRAVLDPRALAWQRLRAKLEAAGIAAPEWVGPRTLAQRAHQGLTEVDAREAARLCAELEALRYGPMTPDTPTQERSRLRALRTALRRFHPAARS